MGVEAHVESHTEVVLNPFDGIAAMVKIRTGMLVTIHLGSFFEPDSAGFGTMETTATGYVRKWMDNNNLVYDLKFYDGSGYYCEIEDAKGTEILFKDLDDFIAFKLKWLDNGNR